MRAQVVRSLVLAFVAMTVSGVTLAQEKDPCFDKLTQNDMNMCETEQYHRVDAELQHVYEQVLAKYATRKLFVEKLKTAQEAWVKFRDAQMDSLYSEEDKLRAHGSVYPMCKAIELTLLTSERTASLKRMLNPDEGDVCGFSAGVASMRGRQKLTEPFSSDGRNPLSVCARQSAIPRAGSATP